VVADVLNLWLRPGRSSAAALRAFSALVPAVATGASIAALSTTQGVWWTIHLWAGAVVLAAATGWLLAYLATSAPDPVAEPLVQEQLLAHEA
jgi:ABC-type amino acid transport system permease subunit